MTRFLCAFLVVGVAIAAAQDYSATNYNAGDSGRSETVSPDGSVTGQYSYTDPNGKLITVKYRAGKDGFQVSGDHLPRAPVPQSAQAPAPQYNQGPQGPAPSYNQGNSNDDGSYRPELYEAPYNQPSAVAPYQGPPSNHLQPQAPTHAPNGYNPFHNPNVPAHLYQQAPTHPPHHAAPQHAPAAPTHAPNGYNPFHNPNVPAHLYQQAPTHPPAHAAPHHQAPAPHYAPAANRQTSAVPTHASNPGQGYNPFYNPDIQNYNPFHNPNVPDHLYAQAPQRHHQPAAPKHYDPAPAQQQLGQPPAGTFSGHGGNFFGNTFSHKG